MPKSMPALAAMRSNKAFGAPKFSGEVQSIHRHAQVDGIAGAGNQTQNRIKAKPPPVNGMPQAVSISFANA